jgi:hypothetical protein
MVGASIVSGRATTVLEALDTIGVAIPGRTMLHDVQKEIQPIIKTLVDEELSAAIRAENSYTARFFQFGPTGSVVQLDEQHSRPQRAGNRAPYCSCVFMNESGKILHISHATKHTNTDLSIKCLAKKSRDAGLTYISSKLLKIRMIVTDSCASAEKSALDIVAPKHSRFEHSFDLWHRAKKLGKTYLALISKRTKSRGPLLCPIMADKVPPYKIKRHFTYCCEKSAGSVTKLKRLWINGFVDHWAPKHNIMIDTDEYNAILTWMKDNIEDAKMYVSAKSTACTESFHNLASKYCPKGFSWSFDNYKTRKNLAVLQWNENHTKSTKTRHFRQRIIELYEAYQFS